MPTGFEDEMLRTNKNIASGLLELTKAIIKLNQTQQSHAENNRLLLEAVNDLKTVIEIANGLKRNFS